MHKILTFAACAFLVAGCSENPDGTTSLGTEGSPMWMRTAPQTAKLAYFQRTCIAYGFKPDTPQFSQCMQTEANNSESRAGRYFESVARNSAVQAASQPSMQTTNCRQLGQTINCTTW